MSTNHLKPPLLALLHRAAAIPIAPTHEDKDLLVRAFKKTSSAFKHSDIIGFFPDGQLTRDGQLNTFRTGLEGILAKDPASVYPFVIKSSGAVFSAAIPGSVEPFFSVAGR